MATSTITPAQNQNEWTEAANKAADAAASAGQMAGHAANAAGGMAKQAVSAAGQKADDLTALAGSGIDHLGQMIGEKGPKDGLLGDASQAVAQTVQRGGQYLEDAKLSGAATALTELIRQHPAPAIAIGIALGFLLGRALRN